jgi:hypothetical protein
VIASLVNLFLASSTLQFVVSIVGILVFLGLTASTPLAPNLETILDGRTAWRLRAACRVVQWQPGHGRMSREGGWICAKKLANLPTNEICRSAKDAMIPRLVEVARNPRRYTSHEIRNVILDAAALTEVMVWPGGFGKEPGPGCEPGVADGPLPWRRR